MGRGISIITFAFLALAACGGPEEPRLMNLASANDGPDEFLILPNKPLEQPEDFAALPPPTPGAPNRADLTPEADLVTALGGRPGAGVAGDAGLVGYATRFGVAEGIREQLAAADLEYRRENDGRLLERLFSVTVYFRAYEPLELDQYRELERFRAAGIPTPSVPPQITSE